jgi:two-component system, LytTR family, sensor kinase
MPALLRSRTMSALRNLRFWLICAAGWVVLALMETTALHFDALRSGRASEIDALLVVRLLADSVWPVVAAAVFVVIERAMAAGASAPRIALRLAVLGVVLAPLYATSGGIAYLLVHTGSVAGLGARLLDTALTSFMWDGFLYSMFTLASASFLLSQRSRRQELEQIDLRARLAQAELGLLRAQLEPHFLFNALNTIAGLVRGAHPELATRALAQLSELLRYVIEASRQDRVPLAWELEFVSNYLELQQIRYGSRLQVAIHQDAAARSYDVPPLLLQPLIENAVVHGAACTNHPARIEVRVRLSPDASELRVEVDNTRGEWALAVPRTGLGLSNTRQRLHRMYGDAFRLDAGPHGLADYRVAISLPHAGVVSCE